MSLAIGVGLLTAAGAYLILSGRLIRVIAGFAVLGHAVNLLLLTAGGASRREPPLGDTDPAATADPLPQAFVLTAIVITFGIIVYLLGLMRAGEEAGDDGEGTGDDPTGGTGGTAGEDATAAGEATR